GGSWSARPNCRCSLVPCGRPPAGTGLLRWSWARRGSASPAWSRLCARPRPPRAGCWSATATIWRLRGPLARSATRWAVSEPSPAVTAGSDRDRVLAALRAELDWPEHPTVLVIEDVHWADDATLDALRYLIRRIADLPAVLVLTYRDDELSREHPLHGLLGQASRSDQVLRLPLRRLSEQAVLQLSEGSTVDAHDLFALTSGNPFFVHELLASAQGERVPPTVADAVLARVRSLDSTTQDVLEQLAVVPSALERWLADALVAGAGGDIVAALAGAGEHGLLTVSTRKIAFRHELTR